jgi:hypothetical protein
MSQLIRLVIISVTDVVLAIMLDMAHESWSTLSNLQLGMITVWFALNLYEFGLVFTRRRNT